MSDLWMPVFGAVFWLVIVGVIMGMIVCVAIHSGYFDAGLASEDHDLPICLV